MQPYFLGIDSGSTNTAEAVDWLEMERSYYDRHQPLTTEALDSGLPDAVIKDQISSAYYFVREVRSDLTPGSTLPSEDRRSKADAGPLSIQAWYEGHPMELAPIVAKQSILEAVALRRTLNFLAPPSIAKDRDSEEPVTFARPKKAYLIPQFCDLVNMRGSVVSSSFLMPSLMIRIESFLYAHELNTYMGTDIPLSLIVEAITLKQANHGHDYERLEYVWSVQGGQLFTDVSQIPGRCVSEVDYNTGGVHPVSTISRRSLDDAKNVHH